ncbi:MAG: S8 family peptidase, partial [bacterium]|nr:S8 family peptidase [bacterium]
MSHATILSTMRFLSFAIIGILLLPHWAFARTSDDPDQEFLWHLEQINAPDAWDVSTGSSDVIVAVIDAGVDHNHEDLSDNFWVNEGEIAGNGIDDEGNGYIDDTYGWDFVHEDNTPIPVTGSGSDFPSITHGTIIAGLIGAVGDNQQGIVGVNWDVQIMVLRALNHVGIGDSRDVARAIEYAAQNDADIINLSLAGDANDPALRDAIQEAYNAGITVIVAVGNEDRDTDRFPSYPSCFEGDDGEDIVIGVASSDLWDDKSDFSNYGEDCVDISAPGERIYSTQYDNASKGFTDAYGGFWGGTSFAAPVVSGAAALLLSAYPDLDPDDVRIILQLSADPLDASSEYDGKLGTGRLNLAAALELAASFSEVAGDAPEPDPEEDA